MARASTAPSAGAARVRRSPRRTPRRPARRTVASRLSISCRNVEAVRRVSTAAAAAGRKLADVTVERLALARIVIRHVDDKRRRRAVVDEVVADPLGAPRAAPRFHSAPGRCGTPRRAGRDWRRHDRGADRPSTGWRSRAGDAAGADRRPNESARGSWRCRRRATPGSRARPRRAPARRPPPPPAAAPRCPLLESSASVRSQRPT